MGDLEERLSKLEAAVFGPTEPEEFRRARTSHGFTLWQHACGVVRATRFAGEEPPTRCIENDDASPGTWAPLYVRAIEVVVSMHDK